MPRRLLLVAKQPLTLMAVHAHPDDEALGTGGVLARYADEGIRTVLVTCTNGELGDGPGGAKPGDPGHDEAEVVEHPSPGAGRRAAPCWGSPISSCSATGTPEWTAGHRTQRRGRSGRRPCPRPPVGSLPLMEQYQPQVVVTYDEYGFYGHPDHIQANRVTMAAADSTGIPAKVYYTAVPKSVVAGPAMCCGRTASSPRRRSRRIPASGRRTS